VTGSNDSLLCIGVGNYYCKVTNSSGCMGVSPGLNILNCSPEGLNRESNSFDFSILPNPATDNINITMNEKANNLSVKITNSMGQVVKALNIDDKSDHSKISIPL